MEHDMNLVVQSNTLINGVPQMKVLSFKLFLSAVTAVEQNRTVRLKISDVSKIIATEKNSSLRKGNVVRALTSLHKESVFKIAKINDDGDSVEEIYSPVSKTVVSNDFIDITFSEEIMPFISNLHNNFTKYDILDIYYLKSVYAISLYQIFKLNLNKVKYSKNLSSSQKNTLLNPTIPVSELRRLTDTLNKYTLFKNFENRIIKPSVEAINKDTSLNISYTKIKQGRSITDIQFSISEKKRDMLTDSDTNLKEEYDNIINSKYIAMLLGSSILKPLDVNNFDKIISLKNIFSKYAIYEKKYPKLNLKKHLAYVSSNMNSLENISNLPEYLDKALDNYMSLLKNNTKRSSRGNKETLPDWAGKELHNKLSNSKEAESKMDKISELLDRTK